MDADAGAYVRLQPDVECRAHLAMTFHSLVVRVSTAWFAYLSAIVLKSLYMCSIMMCTLVASISKTMHIASE